MPSSSKSPQAPSTKSHSFLRKSTDASPSRTTSPLVPSEVRTSQSTISLNPRYKLHIATSPNLLPVVLTFVSQEEAKGSINVDALLDTGCLAGDFVARRIVDRFNIKPVINSAANVAKVHSLNQCSKCKRVN